LGNLMPGKAVRQLLLSTLFLLCWACVPVHASEEPECQAENPESCKSGETAVASKRADSLGGPEQVENRLYIDSNRVTPLFPSEFARGYFDWKDGIRDKHGVSWAGTIP